MQMGLRLRQERERIGLSQQSAALLAGVTRAMWGRYESDESTPNADVLMRLIGHAFDINYVLGGTRTLTGSTLTEQEQLLIDQYRTIDSEGRFVIDRTARMEAMRVQPTPPPPGGNYAPASPASTAVLLHETKAQPKPVKRKAALKD